eukprot:430755_1
MQQQKSIKMHHSKRIQSRNIRKSINNFHHIIRSYKQIHFTFLLFPLFSYTHIHAYHKIHNNYYSTFSLLIKFSSFSFTSLETFCIVTFKSPVVSRIKSSPSNSSL